MRTSRRGDSPIFCLARRMQGPTASRHTPRPARSSGNLLKESVGRIEKPIAFDLANCTIDDLVIIDLTPWPYVGLHWACSTRKER